MNTPNPLVPQGALEHQSKGKSTVRIAIFTIVSIHAVFFAGLLMQGCRQDENKAAAKTAETATNQNTLPALENTYYQPTQDVAQVLTPTPTSPAPVVADSQSSLPSPSVTESAPEGKPYTVAKGDSLAKIAAAHGTTVAAITRINPNLDPSKLKPGQKVQLPAATASPAPAIGFAEPGKPQPGKAESAVTGGNLHTVKAGETLTRIAKQHGTTVKALRAANNLKSDRVFVGQKLKLSGGQAGSPAGEPKTASASKAALTARGAHLAADSR